MARLPEATAIAAEGLATWPAYRRARFFGRPHRAASLRMTARRWRGSVCPAYPPEADLRQNGDGARGRVAKHEGGDHDKNVAPCMLGLVCSSIERGGDVGLWEREMLSCSSARGWCSGRPGASARQPSRPLESPSKRPCDDTWRPSATWAADPLPARAGRDRPGLAAPKGSPTHARGYRTCWSCGRRTASRAGNSSP